MDNGLRKDKNICCCRFIWGGWFWVILEWIWGAYFMCRSVNFRHSCFKTKVLAGFVLELSMDKMFNSPVQCVLHLPGLLDHTLPVLNHN